MENQPLVNNQVQQEPANPVPMNKKPNYWIIACIVLLVIVVIGSIFTLLLNSQRSTLIPPSSIPQTPSPATDETANWKTYTNSKLGYQFKYPADHTVYSDVDQKKPALISAISTSDRVTVAANEATVFCCEPSTLSFLIEISNKNARQRVEEYLDSVPEWVIEKPAIKIGILAGLPAVEASGRGGYGPPHKLIVVPKANSLLVIVQNNNDPLLNQILMTFKFTNPEDQVACMQDAKQCPDGSYVSRQPPSCEFAKCL